MWLVFLAASNLGLDERSIEELSQERREKLVSVLTEKSIMIEDVSVYFGSCFQNRKYKDYHLFRDILEKKPDVWMWTGDAVYLNYTAPNFKAVNVGLYNELKFSEGEISS